MALMCFSLSGDRRASCTQAGPLLPPGLLVGQQAWNVLAPHTGCQLRTLPSASDGAHVPTVWTSEHIHQGKKRLQAATRRAARGRDRQGRHTPRACGLRLHAVAWPGQVEANSGHQGHWRFSSNVGPREKHTCRHLSKRSGHQTRQRNEHRMSVGKLCVTVITVGIVTETIILS